MARLGLKDAPLLLTQKVRGGIVGFLQKKPGSSITAICENTQIAWGTAQHHLYLLGKAGVVTSIPVGRSRAFFAGAIDPQRQPLIALLRQEPAYRIASAIITAPGIMQKELLVRIGMTRKVFRHHMNLLVAAGLVLELRGPKARTYQPTPALGTLVDVVAGRVTDSFPPPTNGHRPNDGDLDPSHAGNGFANGSADGLP